MQTVTTLDNGCNVYTFKTLKPQLFETKFNKKNIVPSKVYIKYQDKPIYAIIHGLLKKIEVVNENKVYILMSTLDEITYNASVSLDNFAYNTVKNKVPSAYDNYISILEANSKYLESGLIKSVLYFDDETGTSDANIIEYTNGEEINPTIDDLNKYLKTDMEIYLLLEIKCIEISEVSKLNLTIKQIKYKENKIKEKKLMTSLPTDFKSETLKSETPKGETLKNDEIMKNEEKKKSDTIEIKTLS